MGDILIRNVPDEVVQKLKQRAERSGRSLQQELVLILTREATTSVSSYVQEVRERQAAYDASGRQFSDSAPEIRREREER